MTPTDAALVCGLIAEHADDATILDMVCDALGLDADGRRVVETALGAVSGLREIEADRIRGAAWDEGYAEGRTDGANYKRGSRH